MVILTHPVGPFLEHHGEELRVHPADCHPLFWFSGQLIEEVRRVEQLLHLFESDPPLRAEATALGLVELEPQRACMV